MTTGTERCPQCDDNNRCGHEWHGDTWEHQSATVIRALTAERDALKAREAKLREALKETSECLHDIATEKGGWAWEEVLDDARAALAEGEDTRG